MINLTTYSSLTSWKWSQNIKFVIRLWDPDFILSNQWQANQTNGKHFTQFSPNARKSLDINFQSTRVCCRHTDRCVWVCLDYKHRSQALRHRCPGGFLIPWLVVLRQDMSNHTLTITSAHSVCPSRWMRGQTGNELAHGLKTSAQGSLGNKVDLRQARQANQGPHNPNGLVFLWSPWQHRVWHIYNDMTLQFGPLWQKGSDREEETLIVPSLALPLWSQL